MISALFAEVLWYHTILWITHIQLPMHGYECESTNLATIHRPGISR